MDNSLKIKWPKKISLFQKDKKLGSLEKFCKTHGYL